MPRQLNPFSKSKTPFSFVRLFKPALDTVSLVTPLVSRSNRPLQELENQLHQPHHPFSFALPVYRTFTQEFPFRTLPSKVYLHLIVCPVTGGSSNPFNKRLI